jgi:hypothetical protein
MEVFSPWLRAKARTELGFGRDELIFEIELIADILFLMAMFWLPAKKECPSTGYSLAKKLFALDSDPSEVSFALGYPEPIINGILPLDAA